MKCTRGHIQACRWTQPREARQPSRSAAPRAMLPAACSYLWTMRRAAMVENRQVRALSSKAFAWVSTAACILKIGDLALHPENGAFLPCKPKARCTLMLKAHTK